MSNDEYVLRYSEFSQQAPTGVTLPPLDDTVSAALSTGKQARGEFLGFDHPGLILQRGLITAPIPYEKVVSFSDGQGHMIEGERLRTLIRQGHIPLPTMAVIGDSTGETVTALDRIDEISIHKKRNAWRTGLLIGLAADITIVIAVCHAMKDGILWGP
jgi:hypothetical protein